MSKLFQKGDTIQGGTLFKEIRYSEKVIKFHSFQKKLGDCFKFPWPSRNIHTYLHEKVIAVK